MKGTAQGQTGNITEALATFQSVVPWIEDSKARVLGQPQLLYWSEQLLAQMAFYSNKDVDLKSAHSSDRIDLALRTYRLWARFATNSNEVSLASLGNRQAHVFRHHVLKAYYEFVSRLLRQGVDYPAVDEKPTRLKQSAEFRNVERMYESELLRSTRFPKAQESNAAIEEWVEQVIENWEVLCGPRWRESDLGEGGRNGVSRNVLDILYRAASKTFHSTLILRRLFQVHKSLTDFDLAYRALDTYLELIERGITRAEKSHELLVGQDDDDTVLRTVSEGIEGLCSFGFRDEAEKAYELAAKVEGWLRKHSSESDDEDVTFNGYSEEGERRQADARSLSPETLEMAYRAIGIGQAHWAKWTPASENRTSLQSEAVSNLKEAISRGTEDEHHLESIYALSLLLAETRDINKAIDHVKSALTWEAASTGQDLNFGKERKLLPLWHLLGLLLTARQEFETAGQTCGAAFEQFPSSRVLFGYDRKQPTDRLSVEKEKPLEQEEPGLVEDMEAQELERIIEIRITELALTEVTEGPEEAVNMTNDLLSLFSRLFGRFGVTTEDKPPQKAFDTPKSSASTVKSFRGSIFARRKHARAGLQEMENINGITTIQEKEPLRQPTRASNAPTIKVTDEDNKGYQFRLHTPRHSKQLSKDDRHSQRLHRREGSINRKLREHSEDRKARQDPSHDTNGKESFETSQEIPDSDILQRRGRGSISGANPVTKISIEQGNRAGSAEVAPKPLAPSQFHDSSTEAKQEMAPIGHNKSHDKLPPPAGHQAQPSEQDVRLPTVNRHTLSTQPLPRFSKADSQKHGLIILVRIWLLIAGLYRRASMFDDSREACDEADKAAMRIETLVAAQESSARAFADAGWGGRKSSDEVWADVLYERATLAVAKGETSQAIEQYEQALMFWPDHVRATVGLSNILLDSFEQKGGKDEKAEARPRSVSIRRKEKSSTETTNGSQNGTIVEGGPMATTIANRGDELRKTPENLNRLAARDRAYGLLSNITKLGTAWDDSEAWFALARAHELGGQLEKSKEVLWWCVELEDRRPVRHWRSVNGGSYVL